VAVVDASEGLRSACKDSCNELWVPQRFNKALTRVGVEEVKISSVAAHPRRPARNPPT
jgi:hypothetical protein